MDEGSGVHAAPSLAEGRYKLIEVIGTGGMATVYRGFDERLHMPRAIKILSPAFARRAKVLARFEGEARTMARLEHPNIVRVYDVGIDGDRAYIVMELLEAGSLVDRVTQHGPLAPHIALDVTADVLRALRVAHQRNVIHRDIKPHNVLVCEDGSIRVTDFGIARVTDDDQDHLTRTGAMMGTWAFMAPEQRTNAKGVDVTADIYSVGATLYSLLTNLTPVDLFAADLDPKMLAGLPDPVTELIRQATRYHREERFADTDVMLAAVLDVRGQLPPLPAHALPVYVPAGTDTERDGVVGDIVPNLPSCASPAATGTAVPTDSEPLPSAQAPQVHGATIDPAHFDGPGLGLVEAAAAGDARSAPVRPPLAAPPSSKTSHVSDPTDGTMLPVDDIGVTHIGPEPPPRRRALLVGAPLAALAGVVAVGAWWSTPVSEVPAPAETASGLTSIPADAAPSEAAAPETALPKAAPLDAVAPETAPPRAAPAAAKAAPQATSHASSKVATPSSEASATAVTPSSVQPTEQPAPEQPAPAASQPTLVHTPATTATAGGTLTFVASINGSSDYDQVKVYYRPVGEAVWRSRSMFETGGQLSARLAVDDTMVKGIEYFVDARSSKPDLSRLRSGTNQSPHRVTVQ